MADPICYDGLRQQFRDIGCRVRDIEDDCFEIVRQTLPVASLVRAHACFIEFNTLIWARPRGIFGKRQSKRDRLLNRLNQVAKVAKITYDFDCLDVGDGGWRLQVSTRFVTGRFEPGYATEAIDHWTTLWLQDIANLILENEDFEVVAVFKP